MTSAGVVRLGLGFVASLLIARALGPADFGVYAVLAAAVAIVGSVGEGGLTEAAVLRIAAVWPADPATARQRAREFFWLRLGLAVLVAGCGCVLAAPVAERLLGGVDAGLLRWALVGIVATAASGAVSAMLQATGAFGRMSALTVANTGLTAALAAILALSNRLDVQSALIVLGIGTSVVTFLLGWRLLPTAWTLRWPGVAALPTEAAHLTAAGRWLWLASVLAMLTANGEVLLLNWWASLPLVGAYALALNLASKADLVNHSLYTVLLPGVAALRDRGALIDYARRGLARSGLIGLGLLVLIVVAEPLVLLVYGPVFAPAVGFLRLLLGVAIFDVLLAPFLLLPLAYRQPRLLAAADGARALTLLVVAAATIPLYGPVGAVIARFAARVAGAGLVLGALWLSRAALEIQHEEPAGVAR